jgi:hypothetical protein
MTPAESAAILCYSIMETKIVSKYEGLTEIDHNRMAYNKAKGVPIMKTTFGVLAVLVLAATVAMGQEYQSKPFPQEANTALAGSTAGGSSYAVNVDVPSSMAANQSGTAKADGGSAFPSAANPSLGRGSDQIGNHTADGGSAFPSAANPSRN